MLRVPSTRNVFHVPERPTWTSGLSSIGNDLRHFSVNQFHFAGQKRKVRLCEATPAKAWLWLELSSWVPGTRSYHHPYPDNGGLRNNLPHHYLESSGPSAFAPLSGNIKAHIGFGHQREETFCNPWNLTAEGGREDCLSFVTTKSKGKTCVSHLSWDGKEKLFLSLNLGLNKQRDSPFCKLTERQILFTNMASVY